LFKEGNILFKSPLLFAEGGIEMIEPFFPALVRRLKIEKVGLAVEVIRNISPLQSESF
jgi:hypothetical protein